MIKITTITILGEIDIRTKIKIRKIAENKGGNIEIVSLEINSKTIVRNTTQGQETNVEEFSQNIFTSLKFINKFMNICPHI